MKKKIVTIFTLMLCVSFCSYVHSSEEENKCGLVYKLIITKEILSNPELSKEKELFNNYIQEARDLYKKEVYALCN